MRVEGSRRLMRQLGQLPKAQRHHVTAALDKSGAEGVRVARTLVAVRDGDLRETIRYTTHDAGMTVTITAGDDTGDGQAKARTVEGGRNPAARAGAMAAQPYIGTARSYLAKRFKGRISRAVRKAAKEVAGRG